VKPDEVAKRLDSRAGYELVTYREVGLPIFGIHATALVQERQERSCIEEFALRALAAGLSSAAQVEGILGLPRRVVDTTLADLVRQEAIRTSHDGETLTLTPRGRELLSGADVLSPTEQTVWFPFDGLLRRPKWFGTTSFLRQADVRANGLLAIRPIPTRPPETDDLSAPDVSEVVRLAAGATRGERQVLRIEKIEKRYRLFLPAIALIYRAINGGEIQVAFAIEGRLSQEHELAFARGAGIERQALLDGLRGAPEAFDKAELGGRVLEMVEAAAVLRKDAARITSSRSAVDRAAVARATAKSDEARAEAAKQEQEAQSDLSAAEASLRKNFVRPVPVYEHPGILEDALASARERLLIVSPWIRRAVVDEAFLRRIEQACSRGVNISLGFGLGNADEGEREWDADARRALEGIASRSNQLHMKRLGNTHAKVLIKDREFFVITSFNWLSFRGNPSKPFRDEWGTMVRDPAVVEEYYLEMMKRFT
jgi:hypothetical protein